ncbi:MAG: iron-containing alcohol dehydrogenase [Tissierellaceae bacterium]|nr:iron-containing alcohol dehydrogenase [Tissierellia bacterium]
MKDFYYYNPTKLSFGKDSVGFLGKLLSKEHKRILLHYGGGSIKRTGLYDQVMDILKERNLEVYELPGVVPNPRLGLVREGIQICKEKDISFILAVGGGSVIDSAKAIAAGAKYDGDVWDFFTKEAFVEEAIPLGVILTIPATGSETSNGSVVTNEDGMLKRSFNSDLVRPEFAILNPELSMTLPDNQTFAGITDIISHVLERYFTHTENVDLTDNLCEGTLRAVIKNSYRLKEDPQDYAARAEIMQSGTIAHSGLLGLGRADDWSSHKIGHEISALYGTTHGVTLSIIFPAWMKYVYKENPARFARFAVEVFGIAPEGKSDEELALEAIEAFENFLRDIGMPTRLKEIGVSSDRFEEMAKKCVLSGPIGQFKVLNEEDIIKIYQLALE